MRSIFAFNRRCIIGMTAKLNAHLDNYSRAFLAGMRPIKRTFKIIDLFSQVLVIRCLALRWHACIGFWDLTNSCDCRHDMTFRLLRFFGLTGRILFSGVGRSEPEIFPDALSLAVDHGSQVDSRLACALPDRQCKALASCAAVRILSTRESSASAGYFAASIFSTGCNSAPFGATPV